VCRSRELASLFEVNGCQLERCARCGFAQVADRPAPEVLEELYSGTYFDSSKYDDDANQRRENERRLAMMSAVGLRTGARVLDAGCATGDFLTAAKNQFEIWGFDVSQDAVAIARELNPDIADRIAAAPAEDVPFEGEQFDAVALWDVIEHVWDPVEIARQLAGRLRPGGYLLMSTPDIGALTARLMGARWAFMTPPEHLGFFSARAFRWMLERELGMETVGSFVAGKWVNVGFLTYKLRRVFPDLVPQRLVSMVQDSLLGRASVYVPTRDIRYITARKPRA
jgi:2-polyprenyl-3-methyl-5-hydroxy-6-metoxy-1,4-benzoquinol methylase